MKRKSNCLTRALDQWADSPDVFRLWYNSNHVISLENGYDGRIFSDNESMPSYLPLTDFGLVYFEGAFRYWLTPKYKKLLLEYLDSLRDEEENI